MVVVGGCLVVITVVGLLLGGLGGGGGARAGDSDLEVGGVDMSVPVVEGGTEVVATATPWPTFTPVPTSTMTPVPPTATPTKVWPTFTPVPTRASEVKVTEVPTVVAEPGVPTPTPYGRYPEEELYFVKQSFFPLQVPEFPTYVLEGRWDDLPRAYDVVSSKARFVAWVVLFDGAEMEAGKEVKGYVRWLDVTPGWKEIVMLEKAVTLDREESVFYTALGNMRPGVWNEGSYRVVFLDAGLNEVVSWEFEVR